VKSAVLAQTEQVQLLRIFHEPWDHGRSSEWWESSCVAFSLHGSWSVSCRRGRGEVSATNVLVAAGESEYECAHPYGLDDRMLCVSYANEVELGPLLLVPSSGRLRSLARELERELRRPRLGDEQIDELCLCLVEATRTAGASDTVSARSRAVLDRLRRTADERLTDPTLDLVAEAASLGLSRTRFIHLFREAFGLTPHRFLLALRTTHAAQLLRESDRSITQVCFASGFGTVQSFQSAFKRAYAMTPSDYRERYRPPRRAHFL
jgi:AraC-like DNA-binding protein